MTYREEYSKVASGARWSIGKILLWIVGITIVIVPIGFALGWFGEVASVAKKEFGPKAALQKYEWFKEAAQQLNAKRMDIENYSSVLQSMEKDYGDKRKSDWPRDVRNEFSQRKSELAGLITAYNALVAEYMAESKKFNWALFEDMEDRPPLNFSEYK
jgi:hypothetical protein